MDPDIWLETLRLSHRQRAQVVRGWCERGRFVWPADAEVDRATARRYAARLRGQCETQQIHILWPAHSDYPPDLLALHDPPPVLFVWGDLRALHHPRRVAVVGARVGTERGRRVAETIGHDLAEVEVAVVSGLAEGVDGAAHQGCLRGGGPAVGVLGTGVLGVYPRHHRELHRRVHAGGCLVSEVEPDRGPRGFQFLARNRIIAALGQALVVVEAGERSGALSTVDFALQLGRDVFALPGPVDCPHAVGTNRLLREGAGFIRGGPDLLASLGIDRPAATGLDLDRGRPQSVEEIAIRHGWTLERTLATLTEWELSGRVRRVAGGRYEPCE